MGAAVKRGLCLSRRYGMGVNGGGELVRDGVVRVELEYSVGEVLFFALH